MNDTDLQPFRELASDLRRLTSAAHELYAVEVATIIDTGSRDTSQIERVLDGLLDFCFETSMVTLYRTLCRYYFTLNPQATIAYVHAYRDMWDNEAEASDE